MIREKTILCKLNQCNFSDKQLWEAMTPTEVTCPGCGAKGCCHPHDSYDRYSISIHNGSRQDALISVHRVICASCGKTHAILPDLLIPFGSFTLRFVLHILKAYLSRNRSVAVLCESFSISLSTLYKWIHLFREHANLFLSALNQISWVTEVALAFIENIPLLPSLFFRRYCFSFLQNHKTAT